MTKGDINGIIILMIAGDQKKAPLWMDSVVRLILPTPKESSLEGRYSFQALTVIGDPRLLNASSGAAELVKPLRLGWCRW
jgi:hypothetical protein